MQKYTPQQYNDILYKLPQEIRDVVISLDTSRRLYTLGDKHKLQIDQIGIMHDITMDTMMGIIASKNIIDEVAENCNISRADAGLVVHDIDEEVFKPIKELMVKLYSGGAPFKPVTLKTADEKDEDHADLSAHDILREIEDPIIVESLNFKVESAKPKPENTFITTTVAKEIEVYHTEISLGKKIEQGVEEKKEIEEVSGFKKENSPTGISNIEEIRNRLLESVASKKLTNVFAMPQVGNTGTNSIPVSPDTPPKRAESGVGSGDPYREGLK